MKKIFFTIALWLMCCGASAQELRELVTFRDWSVFTTTNQYSANYCYALATPYKTRAFNGLRNLPYFMIRHFGGEQFSLSATPGFGMDVMKGFILNAGNRSHLFSKYSSQFAWTGSHIEDKAILNNMLRSGEYFTIRSYNNHGETALDYYSTRGLSETLRFMAQNCR